MHFRGPRAHRVAVLTSLVWAAITAAAVLPAATSDGHPAAQAAADEAPRPALASLIMNNAPLAYWPLQDASAAVAHDDVGGHDGTGSGPVQIGQVGPGPGTTSDGFDGHTARVTAPAAGLAPGAVAVSAWVRTPRRAGANDGTVVDTGGMSILIAGGRAVGVTCGATSGCRTAWSSVPITDGAWHQVALSADAGVMTVYVDGRGSATAASTGVDAPTYDGRVTIGRSYVGNIDNVALFAHPLSADELAREFGAGSCPQAAGTLPVLTAATATMPPLPLHTSGRWILDAGGHRVKLAGVNWYGAEQLDGVPAGLQCQSADAIAAQIAAGGFNVVRLPWATDAWVGGARPVPPVAVAGDPSLRGKDARAVFDAVIAALGRQGVMVILDNHVGRPDWCCATNDGNALWWTSYDPSHPPTWRSRSWRGRLRLFVYGQQRWLAAWRAITWRYSPAGQHPQSNVIGADLRNEPRADSILGLHIAWRAGRVPVWLDWPRAAQKAGNAVLGVNPRLLVMVEGINYGTNLQGVAARPIHLVVAHRLTYSAHDYSWLHASAASVRSDLGRWWGWLLTQDRSYTSPVLVGEWGSCHPEAGGCSEGAWLTAVRQYLADADIDWAYWAVNGTSARAAVDPTTCAATPRTPGCPEGYGLLDPAWARTTSPALAAVVTSVEPATQGP